MFPPIDENKKIGSLVKTSAVDFPGCLSSALFLHGCNLRCPYCYNIDLVTGRTDNYDAQTFDEVITHLKKRKNVISGFVISGGEPTVSPYLPHLIQKAKALGYKIKLDTNGMKPKYLASLIENPELTPDFIALDFKTTPQKYNLLGGAHSPMGEESAEEKIKASIALLSRLPEDMVEFRTVLVPPLVSLDAPDDTDNFDGSNIIGDIEEMASYLPENASWVFAQFQNESCIDPAYTKLIPYSPTELNAIIKKAQEHIPKAYLR